MLILTDIYEVQSEKENRAGNRESNAFGQVIHDLLKKKQSYLMTDVQ